MPYGMLQPGRSRFPIDEISSYVPPGGDQIAAASQHKPKRDVAGYIPQDIVQYGGGDGGAGGGGGGQGGPKKQSRKAAFQEILDLILSRGATNPALLNRQIQGIQRAGESDIQGIEEGGGEAGLGSSGVVQAIAAARKAGTAEQISQARAEEARLQEQRQRQDIIDLIFPLLQMRNQRRGQNLALQAALAAAKGGGGFDLSGLLGSLFQGTGTSLITGGTTNPNQSGGGGGGGQYGGGGGGYGGGPI